MVTQSFGHLLYSELLSSIRRSMLIKFFSENTSFVTLSERIDSIILRILVAKKLIFSVVLVITHTWL